MGYHLPTTDTVDSRDIGHFDPVTKYTLCHSETAWGPIFIWVLSTKYTDDETGLVYYGFRFYVPESGRWSGRDPLEEWGGLNLSQFSGNDAIDFIDPLGLTGYTVYRQLDIPILNWGWYLRMSGHIYFAFDDTNTGAAWRETLDRYGYVKSRSPYPENIRAYNQWITMSFHPYSVKNGDGEGDLVWTVVTEGSWVDINNYDSDINPIIEGKVIKLPLTTDEAQQIKLFETAQRSADINRLSMGSADNGYYSATRYDCGSWAKWNTIGAGLSWPAFAYLWNGGTALGGPMDYTGLPQLTYGVSKTGYYVYKGAKTAVDNVELFPKDTSGILCEPCYRGILGWRF